MSNAFFEVLNLIAGSTEAKSVEILQMNASRLTTFEFHLLLGRAIRQPELLTPRFEHAMKQAGCTINGDPLSCTRH